MKVLFGGPDKPRRLLRDLLAERIDATPSGGEIIWATYYFRDPGLAEALVRAKRRGAIVKVCIEGSPRHSSANQAVTSRLSGTDGLGDGFRAISHLLPAHVHEKVYVFSHPSPAALVGSFNPSGASPEDQKVIRKIGDQDSGHNYLVELNNPDIVQALRRHVMWLFSSGHHAFERFTKPANETPKADGYTLYFFPRRDASVLPRLLAAHRYETIRIAASHIRDGSIARILSRLARTGTSVEVIAHHTRRRVPGRIEALARDAGIRFHRYCHPLDLPMHNKFILLSAPGFQRVLFGSMNLTRTSRWLNHEVLVEADEPQLFDAFNIRWEQMLGEIRSFQAGSGATDAPTV